MPPAPPPTPTPEDPDSPPGVPGFRSWTGVYVFVIGVFVLIVVGLTLFTRLFS